MERIRQRGEDENSWCARQLERCVAALGHTVRGVEIETDSRSPAAVAEEILRRIKSSFFFEEKDCMPYLEVCYP